MLDTLKEAGRNISNEISRAWEALAEGWRELIGRCGDALTQFGGGRSTGGVPLAGFPSWSLLAGEVEEGEKEVVVRLELPGIEKSDCQVTISGNTLILSGTRHFERISEDSAFHVMERAYGAFERRIALPRGVVEDGAEAVFRNGVLTVRLRKDVGSQARTIAVS